MCAAEWAIIPLKHKSTKWEAHDPKIGGNYTGDIVLFLFIIEGKNYSRVLAGSAEYRSIDTHAMTIHAGFLRFCLIGNCVKKIAKD